MKDWNKTLITPNSSILKAIKIIDEGAMQIALVVDNDQRLLGTVTDGDIRRGILKGISLEDEVQVVMNPNPIVVTAGVRKAAILSEMKLKGILQIPMVDKNHRLIGLEFLNDLMRGETRDNWVVLMAGGLGTRLRPLTDDCPKPLLKVGDKPLLETILLSFLESGFKKFYFSVNYMAKMVEDYFGDGSKWGIEIRYIYEKTRLGTAGALSLLPERPNKPLIVMNGDLLTKVNFPQLLDFHSNHKAQATMCVREYDFQVPYGVAKIDNHRLVGIEEKPIQRFFVSAGIYVLEPKAVDLIPRNSYFDMPNLFDKLIALQEETSVFPIREYWLDIGRMDDYEKAKGEYAGVFKC